MNPLITQATERLREKILPYFSYEVDTCGNCSHDWYSHYWNGAGNPDNSGWDSCKTEDCTCKWEDAEQRTDVLYEDDKMQEVLSALADTLKIVGEEVGINFTSSKWESGTVNRNDPFYHAIHTALMDISTWSKAGGKLELHHIDNYARKIMKAANQEQRQRLELVVEEMRVK